MNEKYRESKVHRFSHRLLLRLGKRNVKHLKSIDNRKIIISRVLTLEIIKFREKCPFLHGLSDQQCTPVHCGILHGCCKKKFSLLFFVFKWHSCHLCIPSFILLFSFLISILNCSQISICLWTLKSQFPTSIDVKLTCYMYQRYTLYMTHICWQMLLSKAGSARYYQHNPETKIICNTLIFYYRSANSIIFGFETLAFKIVDVVVRRFSFFVIF